MKWLLFALATPVFFGATNFIEKFLVEKKIKDPTIITLLIGFTLGIFSLGLCLTRGLVVIPLGYVFVLLISGALLILYLFPYFQALAIDEPSRIVPLFQFSSIYTLLASVLFLGERLTNSELIGFGLILVGGFVLGLERFELGIFLLRKSFWFMVGSSFLWALVRLLFKFSAVAADYWTLVSYQYLGAGLTSVILAMLPRYRRKLFGELPRLKLSVWLLLLGNGGLNILANLTNAYALLLAPVALVGVVSDGSQPLFLLLGGIMLTRFFPQIVKEDIRRITIFVKIVAIAILIAGIIFIYI